MADSLILMTTPTTANVLANGVLPLSTISRRVGRIITSSNNSVILYAPGYYDIDVTVTFTAPEAGTASIELQSNGATIPGATASTTITTADTEVRSLTIPGYIVRTFCNVPITLTIVNSGVAIDTSNIALSVKYLG